jgi:hypothetical protein
MIPPTRETSAKATNRDAAHAWLDAGCAVFPCKPDKTPLFPWRRLTLENTRRDWDRAYVADPMPGLDCQAAHAVVVDLDAKTNGIANFKTLCRERGIATGDGLMVRTATGGVHLIFDDPKARWRNSTSKIALGVDTRGFGGYVVAAGAYRDGCGFYEPVRPATLAEFIAVIAERRLKPPPQALAELLDAHCLPASMRMDRMRASARSCVAPIPVASVFAGASPIPVSSVFRAVDVAAVNEDMSAGVNERWTLEGALAAVASAATGTRNDVFASEAFTAGLRAWALGLDPKQTIDALIDAAKLADSDDPKSVDTITRCFANGAAEANKTHAQRQALIALGIARAGGIAAEPTMAGGRRPPAIAEAAQRYLSVFPIRRKRRR